MSKELTREEIPQQPVVEGEAPGVSPGEEQRNAKPRSVYRITLLTGYENTLHHSMNTPDITLAAAAHGYDVEKLQEGRSLFQDALDAHHNQKRAYAVQMNATKYYNRLRANTVDLRMKIVKTLRLAYEGDSKMINALGIRGRSFKDFPRWVGQTRFILEAIDARPEAVQTLGDYSITPELIAKTRQALEDTIAASRIQEKARARALESTLLKDKAFQKIKEWITDYRRVMKTALKDSPHLLQKLVIHK